MASRPTSALSLGHGQSYGTGAGAREKSYFEQQREALIGEIAMVRSFVVLFLGVSNWFLEVGEEEEEAEAKPRSR